MGLVKDIYNWATGQDTRPLIGTKAGTGPQRPVSKPAGPGRKPTGAKPKSGPGRSPSGAAPKTKPAAKATGSVSLGGGVMRMAAPAAKPKQSAGVPGALRSGGKSTTNRSGNTSKFLGKAGKDR